jgi:hypothetical protein
MNYPAELYPLVIRNMEVVEEAPHVVEVIEKNLFAAINARIEKRVKAQGNWKGCYDLVTDNAEEATDFAPAKWPETEEGKYAACFCLDCTEGTDNSWLAHAIGYKGIALYLYFYLDHSWFELTLKEYKQRLSEFYAATPALAEVGFHITAKNDCICRQFSFDAGKLAEEYPDFDEALAPLDAALDDVFKAHTYFDALIKGFK